MRKLLMTLCVVLTALLSQAQVTTSPNPLQEDSQNVEIYFHADQGNKGMINLPAGTGVYAHTGVNVVDAAGKTTNWKYAPTWGDNAEKYRLTYVSPNLWKLSIGNIRTYYGVGAGETIKQLCFVFRTADCKKEGKGTGNTDIFVDVLDSGFQLSLSNGLTSSVAAVNSSIIFTAATTQTASITLTINGTQVASQQNVTEVKAPYTLAAAGEYKVECKAVAGDVTLTESMTVLAVAPATADADKTIPPLGLTKNVDGSYTFCMAAPQKQSCVVIGSWNDYQASAAGVCRYVDCIIDGQPFRYFKTTIPAGVIKGAFAYYYCIDLTYNVGDPYARLVLDPYNDKYISASVYPGLPEYPQGKVPNNTFLAYHSDTMLDYDWQCKDFKAPDKENLVIYELLFRDFTGTEGKADGNGTVNKAYDKLGYLKDLGINTIELLPINEFNGNISWGYNPNFYMAVDKAYGTPADYKRFIDRCHELGIAVILDVVFNQADGCHPWYQLYEPGKNPFFNLNAPHAYSVLNDWNQGYPLVGEQWRDMLQFWLREYKVDGFRFDLVKGLGDNDSYSNSGDAATNAFNQSRIDRMKQLHGYVREVNPDAYFINENLAGAQEENEMARDGELNWMNLNNAGCQFAMGYQTDSNLNSMNAKDAGRTPGSTVAYLESHDEERLAYKQNQWGVAGVKGNHAVSMQRLGSAAAQMILMPGSHMIWQFSEMGNAQTTKSSGGNNTDPKTVNWNLLKDADNNGLMENYRQLIKIRLAPENRELFSTAIQPFGNSLGGWAQGRTIKTTTADRELYCVINPNVTGSITVPVSFQRTGNDDYWIVSKSYGTEPAFNVTSGVVVVPANSYVVVTTRNISGVKDAIEDNAADWSVSTGQGVVRVNGLTAPAYIYSMSGSQAGVLKVDGELNVPQGIYVVRSAGKSVKVMVK